MFHVVFSGSRLVTRALPPAVLVLGASLPLGLEPGRPRETVALVATEAVIVLLAFTIADPVRFRWPARGFAAAGAIGWAALTLRWLWRGPSLEGVPGVVVGALVIGLPGFAYALAGGKAIATGRFEPPVPRARRSAAGVAIAKKLEWLLATNPHLRHEGEMEEEGCGMVWFPRADEAGFSVAVVVDPGEITVHAEMAHVHFATAKDPDVVAAEVIGLVTALLGPDMRLSERLAGGRPCAARLEMRTQEGWRHVTTTGLLLWNYFGPRAERIRQNRWLPGRVRAT